MDIVSGAMLDILEEKPSARIGVGFFDIGGKNMTKLFARHKDTIGVSQLPYYQTALPVFYMYLRVRCSLMFTGSAFLVSGYSP